MTDYNDEFIKPSNTGFTIYCKSGCPNCIKFKRLLQEKNISYTSIDCDEYIIENKIVFLLFMNSLAKKEIKQFPIIFYNEKFVGVYTEAIQFVENLIVKNLDLTFSLE